MAELEEQKVLENMTVRLAHGFTGLLSRVEREAKRQLPSNEDFADFRLAYMAVYPSIYSKVCKSFDSNNAKGTLHPLESIRVSPDRKMEAEKQALIIVGIALLRRTSEERTNKILRRVAHENEITLGANPIGLVREMEAFLQGI